MRARAVIAVRILLFVFATVNFVTATLILDLQIRKHQKEAQTPLPNLRDYLVLVGILIVPYLDLAFVWWGQHMRNRRKTMCKFVPMLILAGSLHGIFYSLFQQTKHSLRPGH